MNRYHLIGDRVQLANSLIGVPNAATDHRSGSGVEVEWRSLQLICRFRCGLQDCKNRGLEVETRGVIWVCGLWRSIRFCVEELAEFGRGMEREKGTDSDQARWDAHVEEMLRMAATCEQIWKEKMKTEEPAAAMAGFATSDDQEFSARRFCSWRCTGYLTAQRWRIKRRTRMGGVF